MWVRERRERESDMRGKREEGEEEEEEEEEEGLFKANAEREVVDKESDET